MTIARSPVALLVVLLGSCCNNLKAGTLISTAPVVVSPSELDFGDVTVGSTLTKALAISNTGSGPLNILSITVVDDGGGSEFLLPTFSPITLEPGSALPVQITFAPTSPGYREATATITTDASPAIFTAKLTGTGSTFGVTVAPASVQFGCAVVNGQSASQTITLTNASNPPQAEAVTVTLSGTTEFQLTPAEPQLELAPDASGTFSVVFSPTGLGLQATTLEITACSGDGGCSPVSLQISGNGTDTALVATPSAVSFPLLPAGASTSQVVMVQASALPPGTSCALPATVSTPDLRSEGDAGFGLLLDAGWDGGFPATLIPAGSFPITVTYSNPGDGGAEMDVAVVSFSVAGQARPDLLIPLNAQTVSGPCELSVNASSLSFGTVAQGQSETEQVQVCNAGTAVCEISSIAIGENDAADEFAVASGVNVPQVLFAAQCTELGVTFTTANSNPPLARDGELTFTTTELGGDGGLLVQQSVSLAATVSSISPACVEDPTSDGDGIGTAATLGNLNAVTFDGNHTLYFTQGYEAVVRKLDLNSLQVTTLAGRLGVNGFADGVAACALFSNPFGVAYDATLGQSGTLFINDESNYVVRQLDLATSAVTTVFGMKGVAGGNDGMGTQAQFQHMEGIEYDGQGHLAIADTYGQSVRWVDLATSEVTTISIDGGASFSDPEAVRFDAAGDLFVDNFTSGVINELPNQIVQQTSNVETTLATGLDEPSGLALDADGNLYVASRANCTISQIVIATGQVSTLAGSGTCGDQDGAFLSQAQFSVLVGMAANLDAGILYVLDTGNTRIRELNLGTSMVSTLAGH